GAVRPPARRPSFPTGCPGPRRAHAGVLLDSPRRCSVTPLRGIVRDLVERRLWPLAALLVLGLVAVPVLLLRPAPAALEQTAAPVASAAPAAPAAAGATPAAAPASADAALADPSVALASSPFAAGAGARAAGR